MGCGGKHGLVICSEKPFLGRFVTVLEKRNPNLCLLICGDGASEHVANVQAASQQQEVKTGTLLQAQGGSHKTSMTKESHTLPSRKQSLSERGCGMFWPIKA